MLDVSFDVLVLLPSMAFAYAILYTFYGRRWAYEGICWIPVTLWLVVSAFLPMREFAPANGTEFGPLLGAIEWTSLVQGLLGVWLVAIAIRRREPFFLLGAATVVTALPFIALLIS